MNQTILPNLKQIEAHPILAVNIATKVLSDLHDVISCKACRLETNYDADGNFMPCTHEEVAETLEALQHIERIINNGILT